jgi:NHLM bacteriocin system ABC transporter ATP-binding protein
MQRRNAEKLLASIDIRPFADEAQSIGANRPILLDRPDMAVLILTGHVDVFAVRPDAEGNIGLRHSLYRAAAGEMIFGPDLEADYGFLVVGVEGTRVVVNMDGTLAGRLDADQLAAILDRYVTGMMKGLAPPRPSGEAVVLDRKPQTSLYRHLPVFGVGRQPTWVLATDGAEALHYFGELGLSSSVLPISSTLWLSAPDATPVAAVSTAELVQAGEWQRALAAFVCFCGACLSDKQAAIADESTRRQRARKTAEVQILSAVVGEMAQTVRPDSGARTKVIADADPLHAAFLMVARAVGIEGAADAKRPFQHDQAPSVQGLAQAYRLRTRKVMLRGDWWRRDTGPLLAFLEDGNAPVALLPAGPGAFDLVDPRDGTARRCTPDLAETLKHEAVMLYRPLPGTLRSLRGLVGFIFPGVRADLLRVAQMGLAGGLLAAFTPMMSSVMIEQVLPRADVEQHIHIILGLVAAAFGGACFEVVKAFALQRVEGRADLHLQASIFDRLLRLPAGFCRRFTAGDLTDRVLGIQAIRQTLSGTTIQSLLGVTFACFSLALLVYYNWRLSIVGILLVFCAIAVTAFLGRRQLREERHRIEHQGEAEGFVLQLLTGLSKLRISAAEGRAYAKWARYFTKQKRRFVSAQTYANMQDIFHAAFPAVATAVIFVAASKLFALEVTDMQIEALVKTDAAGGGSPMSTGDFVAFNTAFGQFLAAMTGLATALTRSLTVVPMFERLRPVVEAEPEVSADDKNAETLRGNIELSHVSFRYDPTGPLVLDDLSLSINENEFVAIVGPSGSGKSTLVRLLLGFETCSAGDIYFDQTPISSLDLTSLRQQVRVVLQNGRLATGSVMSNILGSSALTLDDAWSAARQAGLAADIEAMPMGMHTVLMEGVNTISGGQRQRLMIARALVHRPRVLLLDEPTSALDNSTQATVMESIAHLNATRLVIAHRLSTVRAADRIVVMEQGRIVQQGSYDELISSDGPFAEMARRQLI